MSAPSEALDRHKATLSRYTKEIVVKRSSLLGESDRRQKHVSELIKLEEELDRKTGVLLESVSLVQYLIDELSKKGVAELEAMNTAAVSVAFTEEDYSIEIRVDDRGKDKKADIILHDGGHGGIETLLSNNGDGLSSIISFVNRQFYVVRFGRARFLCLDESFNELSPEMQESFAGFMKVMIQELGFTVLLISHDRSSFIPYADKLYWAEKGEFFEIGELELLAKIAKKKLEEKSNE